MGSEGFFGPLLIALFEFTFEGSKGFSEIVVLYRFQDELTELVLPEDALLFTLHESADQF